MTPGLKPPESGVHMCMYVSSLCEWMGKDPFSVPKESNLVFFPSIIFHPLFGFYICLRADSEPWGLVALLEKRVVPDAEMMWSLRSSTSSLRRLPDAPGHELAFKSLSKAEYGMMPGSLEHRGRSTSEVGRVLLLGPGGCEDPPPEELTLSPTLMFIPVLLLRFPCKLWDS